MKNQTIETTDSLENEIQELDKKLSESQRKIDALERDAVEIPRKLANFSVEADSDVEILVELRRRLDELPDRIAAQQILNTGF